MNTQSSYTSLAQAASDRICSVMWSEPWPVDHVMAVPVPPHQPWVFRMNHTGNATGLCSGHGGHMAFLAAWM